MGPSTLVSFRLTVGQARGLVGKGKTEWKKNIFYSVKSSQTLENLVILMSDFDSQTWNCLASIDDLMAKKDRIGIGGPFSSFLDWISSALSSDIVSVNLPEADPKSQSNAATLIGQRARGEPLVRFQVNRVDADVACHVMGELAADMMQQCRELAAMVESGGAGFRNLCSADSGGGKARSAVVTAEVTGLRQPLDTNGDNASLAVDVVDPVAPKKSARKRPALVNRRVRHKGKGTKIVDEEEEDE